MMDPIKILMAVPDVNEDVVYEFCAALAECGLGLGGIDTRSTKSLIRQFLTAHKDTDIIIISEYQGSESSYTPAEIDDISMECQKALIIPIISEKKGGRYVSELASRGIYSALFEQDASFHEIAELIKKGGRNKAEARNYYAVDVRSDSAVVRDEVFDTRSAVTYLSRYDGTVEDLAVRLESLEDRLSPQEFRSVFLDLPDEMFEMVSRIENYSKVCALMEDQRDNQKPKGNAVPAEDGTKKKLFGKLKKSKPSDSKGGKITPADQIAMAGNARKTYEAGFISTNVGVGCTTSAILFAASVANTHKDLRVALVEFDDADENFDALCMTVTGHRNTSGLNSFKVGNVDFCFHLKYSEFIRKYRNKYDLCVYDFGFLRTDVIKEYVLPLDYKFVCTSAVLWKNYELTSFVDEVKGLDEEHSFIYVVPSVVDNAAALSAKIVAPNTVLAIPFESNPLEPSSDTYEIFKRIYDGKYTFNSKKLGKVINVSEPCAVKSISSKSISKKLLLGLGAACVLAFAIITWQSIRTKNTYSSVISQLQINIGEKEERLKQLEESENTLARKVTDLKRTVVVLTKDVKPGEKISTLNSEVKEVSSEVDGKYFLSPDKIDEVVACVGIDAGVPVYESQTALPVTAPEEQTGEEGVENEPQENQ